MPSAPQRPDILVSETDADSLYALADRAQQAAPAVCELLLGEIDRARVLPDSDVPPDVVGMNSLVEFLDERQGRQRTVKLVYPGEADISSGKVSVLTPIGAGLIGLSPGQEIMWPDRSGNERPLRIIRVERADRAAG